MSFRLQADETAPDGIRRIMAEQIAEAVQALGDRRRNQHKAIHAARQRCKRARAVLRLVQEDLGSQYGAENRCFRDIARGLSDVRDAEAVIEAVDKLQADCKNPRETRLLRSARGVLVARREQVAAGDEGPAARAAQAADALGETGGRIASWPLSTQGFDLLAPGIQKTYAKSRKAFLKAYRQPSDARFHEIRKGVKYHWYQMRIISNVWPDCLRTYRRSVKLLSDLLGDDHDLTVVRQILLECPASFETAHDLEGMLSLIERKQTQLRADAHVLGQRIFAERPSRFRKRVSRYWQAWQEETEGSMMQEQDAAERKHRAVA